MKTGKSAVIRGCLSNVAERRTIPGRQGNWRKVLKGWLTGRWALLTQRPLVRFYYGLYCGKSKPPIRGRASRSGPARAWVCPGLRACQRIAFRASGSARSGPDRSSRAGGRRAWPFGRVLGFQIHARRDVGIGRQVRFLREAGQHRNRRAVVLRHRRTGLKSSPSCGRTTPWCRTCCPRRRAERRARGRGRRSGGRPRDPGRSGRRPQ